MTRTPDNVSQVTDEPAYQEITEYHEESVKNFHRYVDSSKTFDSSDGSVDSGYQSKDCNHNKLMSKEAHTTRLGGFGGHLDFKKDATKSPFLSHDVEIEHKCANYPRVIKTKLCIYLSISFVGNILLILVVVLLATNTINIVEREGENCDLQHLSKQVLQDTLCIPCNNLGSHVTAEDTLFDIIFSCGSKFCCVRNAAIQNFFLLHITATTDRRSSFDNADVNRELNKWRSGEIAAHLYANITSLPERLTWRADEGFGSAFLNGITLTRESRLMVPRAGYYFIYSAVTFKCQDTSKTRLHLINRQHKGRPNAGVQQLLLSKSSECGPSGSHTSFLSGVLYLKSNDEISVNLTEDSISSVYPSSLSNFFGGYLL